MKKRFSFMLILVLAVILSACSGGGNQPANSGSPDQTKQSNEGNNGNTESSNVEEVDDEVLPNHDFGGLTLTYGAPWLREIDPNANEFNERWAARIKELEEKWNFKFEVKEIGWDDYVGNYIRTTLAGEPVADIVYMLTPQLYPNLVENGIVYPVSDLGIIDYNDKKWNKTAQSASEYKGKTHSLAYEGISTRDGIWWNKTLFDQLGLPNLYEIYENGEWTWQKLAEIAVLATKDTNNDGETDIYGFAGDNLPWKLIYSNGYESILKTSDGIDIKMDDPRVIEALEFFQSFYANHSHVVRDWYDGANWDFRFKDFASGNIAMVSAEWWVSGSYFSGDKMQDDYGFLPFPIGPSHNEPVSYGYEASMDVMLATVQNPQEKLIIWNAILDVGTDEDWERWMRESFESTARDAESVKYALLLNDKTKTNLIRGFGDINNIFNSFFNQLSSGETTVQSGLEAINPQIQAALEDFKQNGVDLGIDQ